MRRKNKRNDPKTLPENVRKWQAERNIGRSGRTYKHFPQGVRGMRVLSFIISEKAGAACAVWGPAISTAELDSKITGVTVCRLDGNSLTEASRLEMPLDELKQSIAVNDGDIALLWLMPSFDAESAQKAGLIDCGFTEYSHRVEEFADHVASTGAIPLVIEITTETLLSEMKRLPEVNRDVPTVLARFVTQWGGLDFEDSP